MTRLPWLLHSDLGDDMAEGKASPGSPFKPPAAVIWNNMVDAGRAWADSRLNGGAPNPIRPRETDIIKAKNTSGAARRLGEILRIDGKAIETVTDENKWLLGVEPTDDGYFGILKEPAAISGIASLQVSGCCMALVNVTDADHKRATSAEGEYVLQSGDDGPIEILFAPEGTGEKTCVVRFAGSGGGGVLTVRFRIVAATAYCAECYATARVISGPPDANPDTLPGTTFDYEAQYYTIKVYDMGEGWLNYPPEELLNMIGHATWLRSYEDGPCSEVPSLHWEIIDMQDPEEETCE